MSNTPFEDRTRKLLESLIEANPRCIRVLVEQARRLLNENETGPTT